MPERHLVTGGACFVGSHLCEKLLERGEVVCVDSMITGAREKVQHLLTQTGFSLFQADCITTLPSCGRLDGVWHLASLASPVHYLRHPVETLRVGSEGTHRALERALADGARFLITSTSEVYGDPLEHPQSESYWGNVNCVGPRGCYDESKRYAEALTMAFHAKGVDTRIARIFNTYGPRMNLDDGRVVPAFLAQALQGKPLTIFGDGSQTRSFCFIDDMVRGLLALFDHGDHLPTNLGNPDELSMNDFAKEISAVVGNRITTVYSPLPTDDPRQRKPNIDKAIRQLGWRPSTDLRTGLKKTVRWFQDALAT